MEADMLTHCLVVVCLIVIGILPECSAHLRGGTCPKFGLKSLFPLNLFLLFVIDVPQIPGHLVRELHEA